jgi:hypothetical protein
MSKSRSHVAHEQSASPQRQRPLALLIAMALAQWAAGPAHADSGNGVDTSLANALNPTGQNSTRAKDADGLGAADHSRSPTGFMYPYPWAITPPNKTESGWVANASVELGGLLLSGDRKSAKLLEYRDLKRGPYLNHFSLQAEKPADAYFVDVVGGGLGRDDQFLGVSTGHYNSWKLKAFYNETPHVFTSSYRNLWSGTGSDKLTLNSPLTAGPAAPATVLTTEAAVRTAVQALPDSTLSLVRKKGGLRLDLNLPGDVKLFASYTNEKREGARPFGMVFGGGGGAGALEVPESINYNTHDFLTGVQWANDRTHVNVQLSASMFRNHVDTQTIENPLFVAAANGLTSYANGQFDLYPDNDATTFKAEVAHTMPELARARVTGVFVSTSTRQNDALIASVPQGAGTAVVGGIAGGNWASPDSLSKSHAGARIDSKLFDLGLSLSPLDALQLKAKLRRYETDNSTEYFACNPLTGQWGRLINNGSGAAFTTPALTTDNPNGTTATGYASASCNYTATQQLGLLPASGNVNIRNIPFDYKQTNFSLGADYRLAMRQNLTLNLERENFDRSHRERDRTSEDRVKLGYINRDLAGGTVRASAELARRRGSTYNPDPYHEFYSSSLAGIDPATGHYRLPTAVGVNTSSFIHVQPLHRKFDLADRDVQTFNLRFNHAISAELDFGVALQLKDSKYPSSEFGRTGHWTQNSLNAELNWQAAPELGVYAYLTQQLGKIGQAGVQPNGCVIGNTYYYKSDGSISTLTPAQVAAGTNPLTPAQIAAGITTLSSNTVSGSNWEDLCGAGASPTNPLFNTGRAWTVSQKDSNTTAGVGMNWDLGRARLDANYAYSHGRTQFAYTYNASGLGLQSGTPTAAQQIVLDLINAGLADQVISTQSLDASLLVPMNKAMAVRLLLRHEVGKYRDPHYDGVAENRVPYATANPGVYLDAGPQDYKATAVGVMLQLNW